MSDIIKIKKGLNINLKGKAEKLLIKTELSDSYALKPTDFTGITPKLIIQAEQQLKAGSAIFHDKNKPEIIFTSPVSGKITSIIRGERRSILEIIITPDLQQQYEDFGKADPALLQRDEIINKLLQSGLWPSIKQRPYGIIANPKHTPHSIFISAFDTSPLAPDYDFVVQGHDSEFQTGINALAKLTSGKIHLGINADEPVSQVFTKASNVQVHKFSGPHPAGNVGIQIHHIQPVNKGEVVWCLNPQDVILIGRLFEKGIYDPTVVIALTGSEVKSPRYFKVIKGCSIQKFIKNNVEPGDVRYVKNNDETGEVRYISGNVLTGTKITGEGYLGYYDYMVTVIPEGRHFEFLGWAKPGINKFSASGTFLSRLFPGREFRLDTNYNGGHRALVMTGEYEKVFPMDIYPQQLIKAILAGDIELMENLGIYEVVEEDLALCEYVCTSKTEVQQIIHNGIELMIKEMN